MCVLWQSLLDFGFTQFSLQNPTTTTTVQHFGASDGGLWGCSSSSSLFLAVWWQILLWLASIAIIATVAGATAAAAQARVAILVVIFVSILKAWRFIMFVEIWLECKRLIASFTAKVLKCTVCLHVSPVEWGEREKSEPLDFHCAWKLLQFSTVNGRPLCPGLRWSNRFLALKWLYH